MSLHTYSSTLRPERRLRIIVLASALCLTLAGIAILCTIPTDTFARAALLAGWCGLSAREFVRQASSFANLRALRIDARGSIVIVGAHDAGLSATLLPGSVVLSRYAWLRCRSASGRVITELFRGATRGSSDWRRLQVIWRHSGAGA